MADEYGETYLSGLERTKRYFELSLLDVVAEIDKYAKQGHADKPVDFANQIVAIEGALKSISDMLDRELGSERGKETVREREKLALMKESREAAESHNKPQPKHHGISVNPKFDTDTRS